jgi:hypothetical protein
MNSAVRSTSSTPSLPASRTSWTRCAGSAPPGRQPPGQYLVALRTTLEAAEEALLLIKHPGFREELETRHCTVVVADEDRRSAPASVARFRHSSYGMTPFLRLTGGDDGVSDAVTETPRLLPIRAVSMSPSPNGAASVQSLEALLFSHGLGDVPVRPSEIPFRT